MSDKSFDFERFFALLEPLDRLEDRLEDFFDPVRLLLLLLRFCDQILLENYVPPVFRDLEQRVVKN